MGCVQWEGSHGGAPARGVWDAAPLSFPFEGPFEGRGSLGVVIPDTAHTTSACAHCPLSQLSHALAPAPVRLWPSQPAPAPLCPSRSPPLPQHDVLALAWRPDGKQLASSTLDGQIYFWDPHDAVLQVWGLVCVGAAWCGGVS